MAYNSDYRYITLNEFKTNYDYGDLTEDKIIKYISKAEKLIDLYVGPQIKFLDCEIQGVATSGSKTTLIDTNLTNYVDKYFTYCYLIIVDGKAIGEERFIIDFDSETSKITVDIAFSEAIDNSSIYRIIQKSQFPRAIDYVNFNNSYYKYIPSDIKISTCLQAEWMIKKGLDFIREGGDKFISETMGAYSYQKAKPVNEIEALICPEAKHYLKRFKNRLGKIVI